MPEHFLYIFDRRPAVHAQLRKFVTKVSTVRQQHVRRSWVAAEDSRRVFGVA